MIVMQAMWRRGVSPALIVQPHPSVWIWWWANFVLMRLGYSICVMNWRERMVKIVGATYTAEAAIHIFFWCAVVLALVVIAIDLALKHG
jgi:hypothetical protein